MIDVKNIKNLVGVHVAPYIYNSKEFQKILLKIDVSKGSKCILLDDNKVLLNRNSIISILSIDKFIVNISYEPL